MAVDDVMANFRGASGFRVGSEPTPRPSDGTDERLQSRFLGVLRAASLAMLARFGESWSADVRALRLEAPTAWRGS